MPISFLLISIDLKYQESKDTMLSWKVKNSDSLSVDSIKLKLTKMILSIMKENKNIKKKLSKTWINSDK